jgi:hypothetical protein
MPPVSFKEFIPLPAVIINLARLNPSEKALIRVQAMAKMAAHSVSEEGASDEGVDPIVELLDQFCSLTEHLNVVIDETIAVLHFSSNLTTGMNCSTTACHKLLASARRSALRIAVEPKATVASNSGT